MAKLDNDTIALYKLIAKHGSDWVKKRLCPKEAAQYAVERHYNVMTPASQTLAEVIALDNSQARRVSWLEGSWDIICKCEGDPQAPTKIHPECPQHGSLGNVTLTDDDGEPQ
jgi:hypothetical protein